MLCWELFSECTQNRAAAEFGRNLHVVVSPRRCSHTETAEGCCKPQSQSSTRLKQVIKLDLLVFSHLFKCCQTDKNALKWFSLNANFDFLHILPGLVFTVELI